MSSLDSTPGSSRVHIGVFGRTNSGKSSVINAWTKQKVSIVSEVEGTTTDPVSKPMEIHPIGPCVIIDTAGFGDTTELGAARAEKTLLAAERTDIGVIVVPADAKISAAALADEMELASFFEKRKTPYLILLNKSDLAGDAAKDAADALGACFPKAEVLSVSTVSGAGISEIGAALTRLLPEDYASASITGSLVSGGDSVVLVMPQDIQAPKGRLILPQVQTIRELLDKKCHVTCCTTDEFVDTLSDLKAPPRLIITDSQVFGFVYENKPAQSLLTSFSVLMAAQKGDIEYFTESARAIAALTPKSRVLIAEACTHAPLEEDIGRVKIPNLLRKRIGEELTIDMVAGMDFPSDLSGYDLIIQCGSCMFNRKYVLSRVDAAKSAKVPMTNYGVTIAYLTGILDRVVFP